MSICQDLLFASAAQQLDSLFQKSIRKMNSLENIIIQSQQNINNSYSNITVPTEQTLINSVYNDIQNYNNVCQTELEDSLNELTQTQTFNNQYSMVVLQNNFINSVVQNTYDDFLQLGQTVPEVEVAVQISQMNQNYDSDMGGTLTSSALVLNTVVEDLTVINYPTTVYQQTINEYVPKFYLTSNNMKLNIPTLVSTPDSIVWINITLYANSIINKIINIISIIKAAIGSMSFVCNPYRIADLTFSIDIPSDGGLVSGALSSFIPDIKNQVNCPNIRAVGHQIMGLLE